MAPRESGAGEVHCWRREGGGERGERGMGRKHQNSALLYTRADAPQRNKPKQNASYDRAGVGVVVLLRRRPRRKRRVLPRGNRKFHASASPLARLPLARTPRARAFFPSRVPGVMRQIDGRSMDPFGTGCCARRPHDRRRNIEEKIYLRVVMMDGACARR